MLEIIRIFVIGIIVGMANVIPGVSGGTLAVVFNIYDKFVNAITFNVKKLWANKRFVIPLLTGMAMGVLILSKIITKLYERFPFQTNCFFTGLVLGSIPLLLSLVLKRAPGSENQPNYFTVPRIVSMVICAVAGIAVLIFFDMKEASVNREVAENMILPAITFPLVLRLFIAGCVGAVAMIIPGISGSLLMLMMGVYTIVISAIPALFVKSTMFHAFFLLIPNGIGVLLGLLCGAKLISYLLKKAPHQTYAVIFGLICGSVFVVFPGFSGFAGATRIISGILCIIAGAAMAYFSSKFEPKSEENNN